jgi:hypothetical protein
MMLVAVVGAESYLNRPLTVVCTSTFPTKLPRKNEQL